jgi:DNA-directed RNA polymerase subunit M/transcription elongation factor TFIIS
MQNLDQEWRELSERYEQMTEEELQLLANEAYELTDMAKEILQSEVARRSLKIKLLTEPPAVAGGAVPEFSDNDDFDPVDLDLVEMTPVWDMEDARRVKGILDNSGVPSYYGPDNTENVETLSPLFAAAASETARRGYEVGIAVKVPRRYSNQAARAFANWAADHPPNDPDPTAEADYTAQCPKCRSPEIVFEGVDGSAPNPAEAAFKWHCDACGHTWSDDGVEEERSA